ncbi:zf-DHHC-domain-containing protein [Trametopsis cervina]|nr:zf-DHHC-domain-containing protein [Trametopsis cervina]
MICAQRVFRCFKCIERAGDAITGAAGPFFIFLAVTLISTGVVCFFDVIQPTLPWPWLTTPLCVLVVVNLFAHYYYVCTVPPGFVDEPPQPHGTGWLWAKKRHATRGALTGVQWSDDQDMNVTKAAVTKCRKCGEMRPERAHHCRICKRCVLKYDHHCPVRINQCVGLHNERHFVLFLVYLSIASFVYAYAGWEQVLSALGWYGEPWEHRSPEIVFLLIYILAAVLFLAVTVMGSYHLYGVSRGETSVEAQDHEHYRHIAKRRGEDFVNSYDLGRRKNLQIFFNIGRNAYPAYTLIIPLRIEPFTDGRSWARRKGLERHPGIRAGEELTDEEDI